MIPDTANWPARWPKACLTISVVLITLSAGMVLRLGPDTSLESFFPSEDPAAEALQSVLHHFPVIDEMLVMVTLPRDQADDPPAV